MSRLQFWGFPRVPLLLLLSHPFPSPYRLSCSSPAEVMFSWHLLLRRPELTQERISRTLSTHKKGLIVNQIPLSFRITDLTSIDLLTQEYTEIANTPGLRALRSEHNQINELCPPSEFS